MANTEKKMTKAQAFAIAMEIVEGSDHPKATEVLEKIAKEIEQLAKKNSATSGKPTAKQTANMELTNAIEGHMAENPNQLFTITDLIKSVEVLDGLSTQKVRPLMKPLLDDGTIKSFKDKGKTLFQWAGNEG